ncbi:MAG: glycogen synthase GlgA [Pseudomonas sp.]|uniref:glycogen synthase GlgA n=1 Tax=Pseudomonas sp. TaxID=306 RepID=UPI003397C955
MKIVTRTDTRQKALFVTAEIADLVKVGGLGDVSAAIPRAMQASHDVRVLIPGYRQVLESGNAIRVVGEVEGYAALPACKIGRIDTDDGLVIYVVLCPELYDREGTPYGDDEGVDWPDNHIRFARLSLAAAEFAAGRAGLKWTPQLLHLNDWQTALTPAYLFWRDQPTPSIFTIHNLAYQGLCDARCSVELGLPVNGLESNEPGKVSFLKAGILYATHITTVSATYAQEITTPAFGCGLEGLLGDKQQQGCLTGILNGIDDSWAPESDPHLIQGFAANDWAGKQANAVQVRMTFGLAPSNGPIFAVVSRLVHQKGLDLTLQVAEHIVNQGGQIALIGRGEAKVEAAVRELAARFPGQIAARIGFNETDARRMFAGSDFLLMPSRYEPCGLSQMYAQCFGSLPIARNTGGLADSIEDGITGFLFEDSSAESYRSAIDRAFRVYAHPELFRAMRCRAMASPYHWRVSIQPYSRLYDQLLSAAPLQLLRQG